MINCEDRFTYLPYGEEINPRKEDDVEALQTIELLELNNVDYLKDGRGNMMKAAVVAYTDIVSILPITEWQSAIQSLMESYQETNVKGYLEPYCFVAISFFKDCL